MGTAPAWVREHPDLHHLAAVPEAQRLFNHFVGDVCALADAKGDVIWERIPRPMSIMWDTRGKISDPSQPRNEVRILFPPCIWSDILHIRYGTYEDGTEYISYTQGSTTDAESDDEGNFYDTSLDEYMGTSSTHVIYLDWYIRERRPSHHSEPNP